MNYDCSVLGINAPERPSRAWRNMELVTADDKSGDREGAFRNKDVLVDGQRLSTRQLQATAHRHNEAARDMGVRGCDQE